MKRLGESMAGRFTKPEKAGPRSQRAALFEELYGFYERSYQKNSLEDYRAWLRAGRKKHSLERLEEFRKSKAFRKKITLKSFCSFWFSFLKTGDLYYVISVVRDMEHRGMNVNKWLFWSVKPKKGVV